MASEDATMDSSLSELPTTWDDRRLLRHDPFKDLCPLRDLSDDLDYHVRTKAYVKENEEFVRAFIRWCLMAFQPLNGECPANLPKPDDFASDPIYWDLFVDVFYCLYKRNQNAALLSINKEREKLGYKFSWTPAALWRRKGLARFITCASITGGSTESNEDIIDSLRPRENVTPSSSDEIAAACEKFLKTLSVEDTSSSGDGYRRSARKAAPSTTCLREQAQRETEHADSERRKHPERRKKRKKNKAKARKTANTNKQVAVEPKEVILESDGLDTNRLGHINFVETIVVNNEQTATIVQATTGDVALIKRQDRAHSHTSQPCPKARDEEKTGKKKRKQSERAESDCLLSRTEARITTSSALKKQKKGRYSAISEENLPSAERTTKRNDHMVEKVRAISSIAYSPTIWARAGKSNAPPGSAPVSNDSCRIERHHAFLSIAGLPTESSLDLQTPRSASSDETLVDHSPGEDSKMCSENSATSKTMEEQNLILERLWQRKMVESPARGHVQSIIPKPPLPEGRRPSIWAVSRQALCETTSWFRCYHGGVYFSDGKAHGYLLGGFSSQRDIFHHDGRLIISHGGGKQLDGSPGQRDQDASVRSLLYNYREHHPLVILADNNYALFPFDLGEMMYVVLGLYWIVDAWAEIDVSYVDGKLDARIKYKFAFQYCEGQGPPWWLGNSEVKNPAGAKDSNEPDPVSVPERMGSSQEDASSNRSRMDQHSCRKCGKFSPWIYKQGWMCFRPDCSEFFRIEGEEFSGLDYDEAFLQLRPDPVFGKIDLNILSSVSMPDTSADSIYSVRGWFCCKCGQLCPRERWECWECARCKEIFPKEIELPIRDYKEFSQQELDLKHYKVYKIHDGSGAPSAPRLARMIAYLPIGITVTTEKWSSPQNLDRGIRYIFHLPNDLGRVHLMKGNAISNERANTLFREYQEDARDRSFLRRYPLRFHHARGRMLTNYFSHNAGVPYEYAVTTNVTDPFDRAPASVNGALQLIKDRVSTIVQEGADFNEILTAAYMAEQKMSYHTDDESGLGPVVASLSLGSIAFMHFRHRKTATKSRVDKQLTVILRHGDVLVMEGAAIQKSYEHSVVPVNFRIAATARYIHQGQLLQF